MHILNKIKVAFLYGKALKRFNQKNYKGALSLFEKIQKMESEDNRKELTYYYLGICYLELGRNDDALKMLSSAYDIFRDLIERSKDENDIEYFITLTNEYIHLLFKVGKKNIANNVLIDRNKVLGEKGYRIEETP